MNESKNKPTKVFRAGKLRTSIWCGELIKDGRPVLQFSFRITKNYFDKKDSQWKDTPYLYLEDMPNLILTAQKAFEFAALRESLNRTDQETSDAESEEGPDVGRGNRGHRKSAE